MTHVYHAAIGARKMESIYGAGFWSVCHGPYAIYTKFLIFHCVACTLILPHSALPSVRDVIVTNLILVLNFLKLQSGPNVNENTLRLIGIGIF